MEPDIQKIIVAAKQGGEKVRGFFGQQLQLIGKSSAADFKTQADIDSEGAIIQSLTRDFSTYNIQSEERGFIDKHSDYTFVVDPLDGTFNFVLGIPNFTVSIGLMLHDEVVAGVVYHPILDIVYSAQKGQGAFANGQKLHVSSLSNMSEATVAYTCGYTTADDLMNQLFTRLDSLNVKRNLSSWSPAFDLCLLASGKIEAIVDNGNELYDFIAGKLLAREAGALITNLTGKTETNDKNNFFVASNGTLLHNVILAQLTA